MVCILKEGAALGVLPMQMLAGQAGGPCLAQEIRWLLQAGEAKPKPFLREIRLYYVLGDFSKTCYACIYFTVGLLSFTF